MYLTRQTPGQNLKTWTRKGEDKHYGFLKTRSRWHRDRNVFYALPCKSSFRLYQRFCNELASSNLLNSYSIGTKTKLENQLEACNTKVNCRKDAYSEASRHDNFSEQKTKIIDGNARHLWSAYTHTGRAMIRRGSERHESHLRSRPT